MFELSNLLRKWNQSLKYQKLQSLSRFLPSLPNSLLPSPPNDPSLSCGAQSFFAIWECGDIEFRKFMNLAPNSWAEWRELTNKRTILSARPFVGVTTTPIGLFRVGSPATYASGCSLYSRSTRVGTENAADFPSPVAVRVSWQRYWWSQGLQGPASGVLETLLSIHNGFQIIQEVKYRI